MTKEQEQRAEAWVKDSSFTAILDEAYNKYYVQGNNSGFTYTHSLNQEQAEAYAKELNENKRLSKLHE